MERGTDQNRNARKPNPIDIHVGSRVRFRRMLLGMSQEKLGELLGLTFQQVQKYEKGINRIGASRLFEIANVLGVNVQFFYDDAPDLSLAGGAARICREREHGLCRRLSEEPRRHRAEPSLRPDRRSESAKIGR